MVRTMPAVPQFHKFASLQLLGVLAAPVLAQTPAPGAPGAPDVMRVEITGSRQASDVAQRQQSNVAKTVVGRDEIDRFGDSTVGDVLKRLPGVTLGSPSGGGGIRMRGLSGGYTQILIDGEPAPAGFSVESMNSELVERIEVLRAPTAETGARAIAGTIQIITRGGVRKRLNELRLSTGLEQGLLAPSASWTRNGGDSDFNYTGSVTFNVQNRRRHGDATTTLADAASGAVLQRYDESSRSLEHGNGLHASTRLQWKAPATEAGDGDVLALTPFLVYWNTRSTAQVQNSDAASRYDAASSQTGGHFTLGRINAQWQHLTADGTRLEWRSGVGLMDIGSRTLRSEFKSGVALDPVPLDDESDTRERNGSLALKASRLLDNGHNLVAGFESEAAHRGEALRGYRAVLPGGDTLSATSRRLALFAQDEWTLTPQWAAQAGLRWEAINTVGDDGGGDRRNRSAVWSPLLHAMWKPEPKSRDQVRMSLTRSYRAPSLRSLVGGSTSSRHPVGEDNTATTPDRLGNPDLKPELATGLDLAYERYLESGGVLSAGVFHRRISNLTRSLVSLESVPYSATPRWVLRPQNAGDAVTQGVELEAKFRLSDVWATAPRIDWRSNLSVYRSRVSSVPGPNNRLDQQPDATLNLGADYKLGPLPLTLGGNLGWTPAYEIRQAVDQSSRQGRKRVFDAYALWAVSPTMQLRLSASNLLPLDDEALSRVAYSDPAVSALPVVETEQSVNSGYVSWQLRLEMKL
jgi:iron complex outermembrane receptor protein